MGRQGRAVTNAQTERALEALRLGATRRAAAAAANFARSTFYRMIETDATLRTSIERAEGEAEFRHVANVAQQSDKNWQASAWWLERRHPDDFGRRDRVEVTVNTRELAQKVAGDLDADLLVAEAERILSESR